MSTTDDRRDRRMAAAAEIAKQMHASRRFEPPPAEEADAWVWGIYDEEGEAGRVISRGHSVWHRKTLSDEWHRLHLTEEGQP